MSERSLNALIARISTDADFAERVRNDAIEALCEEFDLSTVELLALNCGDEDALRRLLASSEYDLSIDYSMFHDAALPAFNDEARQEMITRCGASGNTSKVTSSGVTKCCWP